MHKSQEVWNVWESTKEELHALKSVYCNNNECSIVSPSWLNFDNLGSSAVGEIILSVTVSVHYMRSAPHACSTTEYNEEDGLNHTVAIDVAFTLTASYPFTHPIISLSSNLLCQIKLHELEQSITVYAQSLVPEHCLFDVLEKLKEDVLKVVHANPRSLPVQQYPSEDPPTNAAQCTHYNSLAFQPDTGQPSSLKCNTDSCERVQDHSILIARIDHMRSEAKYFKLLKSWAKQLQLSGKVLNTGLHSIYTVITGEGREVDEFLKRWKTQCVDIDSHGRPCKEKMISILCQEVIKEKMIDEFSSYGLQLIHCTKGQLLSHLQNDHVLTRFLKVVKL